MMNTQCFKCRKVFDIEKNITGRQILGEQEKITYECPDCKTTGKTVRIKNPEW